MVGDVTDLRPVAPAPGTPWVNPDRPKQKVLARAALEGLAVMTAEAARRSDPEQQLSGKVTRAVKRMRDH